MSSPPVSEQQSGELGLAPTSQRERYQLIDVLRGVALFGVLWVNMMWFATGGDAVPPSQLSALPTAALDRWVGYLLDFFVYAKANTLFAFLFGVSFAIQMGRLEQRTARPRLLFARRLVGLLVIGLVHLFGVWEGEILHVYAVAGFVLILVWRWDIRVLVVVGLALAVATLPLLTQWDWVRALLSGGAVVPPETPEILAGRFAVFRQGSYLEVIATQWNHMWSVRYFLAGFLPWVVYALGRFMLGLAVMRRDYLTNPEAHWREFRAVSLVGLPVGLVCTIALPALEWLQRRGLALEAAPWNLQVGWLASIGTVLMTASYVSLISWAWRSDELRKSLAAFAPVGQMALTNYVMQSLFNSFVFFGYGLGLVGRMGASLCLLVALVFFALQVFLSQAWLARYQFGPLEWIWRWWTYWRRPAWRRRILQP